MQYLISPSKTMSSALTEVSTNQHYDQKILAILKTYSIEQLMQLMKINEKIAKLNYERYHTFVQQHIAIYAYSGLQFSQLNLKQYTLKQNQFLNEHVYIISALYGLVRPFDTIAHYRLEMDARISVDGKSLSQYWQSYVEEKLKDEQVIVLASKEYANVLSSKLNKIAIQFKEIKNGKLVTPKIVKQLRGLFLNYCVQHQLDDIKQLHQVEILGFKFSKESTNDEFIYIKS